MIEVKDRIPTQAGRIKLIDELTGEERYYKLVRADEPIEEGTPINKVLFDSIKKDLSNINKYKIPTNIEDETSITLNLDSSVEYEDGNIIKLKPKYTGSVFEGIPIFTNNNPVNGFELYGDTSLYPYKAFDNDNNTQVDLEYKDYIGITFPYNLILNKITINVENNFSSSGEYDMFEIRGITDDGVDELITIWSFTPSMLVKTVTIDINTTKQYKTIYLFTLLNNTDHPIYLYNVLIEGTTMKNINKININNLGVKNIDGILYNGFYYELAYNLEKDIFDIVQTNKEIEDITNAIINLGGSI